MARNNNIDFLKIILSFFVVAAHVFPTYEINNSKSILFFQIQGLARITLPLFLLISGFYIRNNIYDWLKIKKIAKKLFVIFIIWQLLYLKIEYDFYKLNVISTQQFFIDLFFGIAHLWYLIATVEALFLLYLVRKWSAKNKMIVAVALLIIAYIYQFTFELKILNESSFLSKIYPFIGTSRNFLFYAFPYLVIGTCYNYWKNFVVKYKFSLLLFFIGLVVESYIYVGFKASIFNIFIFPLPISMLLFSLILEKEKQIKMQGPNSLSLGIYLIHFFIVLQVFQKFTATNYSAHFIKFFIVSCITIFLWYFADKLNKKLPIFF